MTPKESDTPETDAFAEQFPLNEPHPVALTSLARRLERERDEAREDFRKLMEHMEDYWKKMAALKGERGSL